MPIVTSRSGNKPVEAANVVAGIHLFAGTTSQAARVAIAMHCLGASGIW